MHHRGQDTLLQHHFEHLHRTSCRNLAPIPHSDLQSLSCLFNSVAFDV